MDNETYVNNATPNTDTPTNDTGTTKVSACTIPSANDGLWAYEQAARSGTAPEPVDAYIAAPLTQHPSQNYQKGINAWRYSTSAKTHQQWFTLSADQAFEVGGLTV